MHNIEPSSDTQQRYPNPIIQKLQRLLHEKQTNLAVAADVTTKAELLALAHAVGPEICMLKVHIDMIRDFDGNLIEQLQSLAKQHQFLLVEDRKFADIGNTVQQQYVGGVYRIMQWADIVIAHAIAGPDSIKALAQAAHGKERGVLLIAQLSSAENLIDERYTQRVVEMANKFPDFVVGFIAQQRCSNDSRFMTFVPGIHCQSSGDTLGQHYNTPECAIQRGADVVIVGRAICQATDPQTVAREYKERAWQAYVNRK